MGYVLKHKQDIFFIFLPSKTLRTVVRLFFSNFFIIFFWWNIYSYPVMFIYKRFNFCYSLGIFCGFFIIERDRYSVLKAFIIIFIDWIYCCIFAFYLVRRIYVWSATIWSFFIIISWKQSKTDSVPFIEFFKSFWNLLRSDSKSSSITSSALQLIMTFLISLFECITRSSSLPLEDVKLASLVKWIFLASDSLRSLLTSFFNYSLILLRYSSTDRDQVFYFYHRYFCIQNN